MILIDTPGFNDSDISRTDKKIFIELVKTLRPMIKDPAQGISSFIHCIMPNASHRITDSTIKAMMHKLSILNSIDAEADIYKHPKIFVVFNDVSIYVNEFDEDTSSKYKSKSNQYTNLSKEERIRGYKTQLKETVKKQYLHEKISDQSKIGEHTWLELKEKVLSNSDYKTTEWYSVLTQNQRSLIEMLKTI